MELHHLGIAVIYHSYIFVGSLCIESLGMLTNASDHETMLLPVGFQ